jgi:hypothetical protein
VLARAGAGPSRALVHFPSFRWTPIAILNRAAQAADRTRGHSGGQLRSCVAHRRDIAGREGGRPRLITEEAPFTAQAFIRDLADWLRQPRASTNGPPQGLREAVQGSFGPNIGYAMLIKMYEGANGKDGTAERRPGCLHGITRADDQPPSITLTRVAGPG